MGDGDGWTRCARGHVHWGPFGASGLLPFHRSPGEEIHVLLQQRAWWGSGGNTWGMFGGSRHSHEDVVTAALRETAEECTLDTSLVRVHGLRGEDHGGWCFTSVLASVARMPRVRPASLETRRAEWVQLDQVERRRLFGPFAASWPVLRDLLDRLVLVVDAANVVGARADGWWRDRAGANARLRDDLAPLAASGVTGLPEGLPAFDMCFPDVTLVVEGAARVVADEPARGVEVLAAPGSGDDAIVDLVRFADPGTVHLVVTADRELRARCEAAGATVTGPRWLLSRLP